MLDMLGLKLSISLNPVVCVTHRLSVRFRDLRKPLALEEAAVEFIPENGGGPGVRLKVNRRRAAVRRRLSVKVSSGILWN